MMDQHEAWELSSYYIADRLAAAEKEWLLRSAGQPHTYLSGIVAWTGSTLIRVGRRLETIGGAAQTSPSFEMRQRAV